MRAKSRSVVILRWPFRILGTCMGLVVIAAWAKLVFYLATFTPTNLSFFGELCVLVCAPLMALFYSVPAVYGYYPEWITAWLPEPARRFMQTRAVDVFTDWPWKRNPRMKNFFSSDKDSSG